MKNVAERLNAQWKGHKAKLHHIPEYYDFAAVAKYLESQGGYSGADLA